MPLIEIYRKYDKTDFTTSGNNISDINIQLLGEVTRELVARELDTPEEPDGHLTVNDIEVQVREGSPLDLGTLPLQIIVHANEFPARRANLDERRKRIATELRERIPQLRGNCFIWILLHLASFEML